jgi:hypothetical protein
MVLARVALTAFALGFALRVAFARAALRVGCGAGFVRRAFEPARARGVADFRFLDDRRLSLKTIPTLDCRLSPGTDPGQGVCGKSRCGCPLKTCPGGVTGVCRNSYTVRYV